MTAAGQEKSASPISSPRPLAHPFHPLSRSLAPRLSGCRPRLLAPRQNGARGRPGRGEAAGTARSRPLSCRQLRPVHGPCARGDAGARAEAEADAGAGAGARAAAGRPASWASSPAWPAAPARPHRVARRPAPRHRGGAAAPSRDEPAGRLGRAGPPRGRWEPAGPGAAFVFLVLFWSWSRFPRSGPRGVRGPHLAGSPRRRLPGVGAAGGGR